MKKIISIVLVHLIGITTLLGQKQLDKYQIQVDGLGCPFCAYGLEKKFKEFKGIKDVAIKIETGDFSFQYPSDKPLTMIQVIDQVKKAGYTPKTASIIRIDGVEESFPDATEISNEAALRKSEILVSGNCDMCKARIEAAALSNSKVQSAIWDSESKRLSLVMNTNIDKETIGKLIAEVGHDNEYVKSIDKVYDELPPCCLYRK